jgi:phosphoserine aminotransferase
VVPASDTGAMEMAMWSLLGSRPVTVLAFETFGEAWAHDIETQLKPNGLQVRRAAYGALPSLQNIDPGDDIVFTWNGTTSGVKVPNDDWIAADRTGLAICDATSAAFAMDLPWDKLDVVTWSWQKALGGEAAHGMLALSPRAVARLETVTPPWPLPKIFRLTEKGKLNEGIFQAETINTPSMLCVEDALDGLRWAEQVGGLRALMARSEANLQAVAQWVEGNPRVSFLAADPVYRSNTAICLTITAPWCAGQPEKQQRALIKDLAKILEHEGVGLDIAGHRDAPPGLRLWGGATVETADIAALLPWIDWALDGMQAQLTL